MEDNLFAAWTAGFFDGEGCIVVSVSGGKTGKWDNQTWMSLIVSIYQQAVEPLLAIHQKYGGNICRGRGTGEWRKTKRAAYKLAFNNGKALDFLRVICPYAILKKDEIEIALQWPRGEDEGKRWCLRNPVPDWARQRRLKIREKLIDIRSARRGEAEEFHRLMVEDFDETSSGVV